MSQSLLAFLLIVTAGAVLRSTLLSKADAERLGSFLFSVSLPATIMVSLDRVTPSASAWKLPAAAGLVTVPVLLCAVLLAGRLCLTRPSRGGFILAAGCINSVYFAYPVALATFGDAGLARAIFFDLGQTTLTLTLLYGVAVWHGTGGGSAAAAAARLVRSPPLWALVAMLTLKGFGWHLPPWLRQGLLPLHWTTTPLAGLVLGLSIHASAIRRSAAVALWGVALRMAGGLLCGALAVRLLGLDGIDRAIVLLIAAMPSAVTAVVFATETGLDEELVSAIVALSICLGVALLPWLPRIAPLLSG